jgi:predicted Zn-dependent protease
MDHELVAALRLFRAAATSDPIPLYWRRAALCALRAGELGVAEEMASAAVETRPRDPSYLRLQADVLRAQRRLDEAQTVLSTAIDLATGSEALAQELRHDLADVQRQLRSDQRDSHG